MHEGGNAAAEQHRQSNALSKRYAPLADVLISLAKRNRSYSMASNPATAMALSARKPSCKLVHGCSAMDRSTEFLIAT